LWIGFEGELDPATPYCFVSRGQVTAQPDQFHVTVRTTAGATLLDTDLNGPRAEWLRGPGC
jgi:hypothetical protein